MQKKEKSTLFTIRMDKETREQLNSLSANATFKYNNSALVKHLIANAFSLTLNPNESK